MKRVVLVQTDHLRKVAEILTGYGKIVTMDYEGTIVYELEGDDAFELGRLCEEIRQELRCYDTCADIIRAVDARNRRS